MITFNLQYSTMCVCSKRKINLAMQVILSTVPSSKSPYPGVSLRRETFESIVPQLVPFIKANSLL